MLTFAFFLAMRKFVDEVLYDDAQSCEESGKRSSVAVRKAMACVSPCLSVKGIYAYTDVQG